MPRVINVDNEAAYAAAVEELKVEGTCRGAFGLASAST